MEEDKRHSDVGALEGAYGTSEEIAAYIARKRESWDDASRAAYKDGVRDLYEIMLLAMKTFSPEAALRWLVAPDPFLEERRPIDVLASEGSERVIAAIAAHDAGVYP